jgi:hypothetical protein
MGGEGRAVVEMPDLVGLQAMKPRDLTGFERNRWIAANARACKTPRQGASGTDPAPTDLPEIAAFR